jgi:hypothetical protein
MVTTGTMATKLFTVGNYGNYDNQLVYFSAKTTERLALDINNLWISMEPLGRFS